MTLKMTKRESVCESVGEGESRRGQKGRGRELLCTLSYTHSLLYPSLQPCREERTQGRGLPAQRGKDRQTVGRTERAN